MTHSVSTQENGVSSSSSPERNMEDDIQLQTFKADQGLEDGQIHPESIRDQSQSNLPSRASTLNRSLPPVDGGVQAWIFVASAFVIEFCAWGFVSESEREDFQASSYSHARPIHLAFYRDSPSECFRVTTPAQSHLL